MELSEVLHTDVRDGTRPRPPLAHILIAFAAIYVVWGSTYLGIRIAVETLPPLRMAGVRFLFAGGILLAIARARRTPWPTPREWRSLAVIGVLLFLGGNGGVMLAARQKLPSGLIAVFVAITPMFIALLDRHRAPLGLRGVLGLALGIAGVAILVVPGKGGALDGPGAVVGVLCVLGASLTWAMGSLLSRRLPLPRDAFASTGGQMLTGGVALMLVGVIAEGVQVAPISGRSALAFVYLVTFGSLIGFSAYAWLLQVVRPVVVATYAYVNPAVALFLGWLIAGEPLTPRVGLGTAVVLAAVVLISLLGQRTGQTAGVVDPNRKPL